MRYQCTECDTVHATFDAAARCHHGIGGVIEVGDTVTHFATEGWVHPSTLCGRPWEGIVMSHDKATCQECIDIHARETGWEFPLPMVVTA